MICRTRARVRDRAAQVHPEWRFVAAPLRRPGEKA